MRIIRVQELQNIIGLSRSTIWRLEKKGLFPMRKKIGIHAIGWLSSDIEAWLALRALLKAEGESHD